jgi:hypothetical protein
VADARLNLVMARLEECEAVLGDAGERETAQLVAMALLQLRLRMHHIGDAELKALCDAVELERNSSPDQLKASGDCNS